MIQDAAVGIGKFRPEFQIALDGFWFESSEHSRLEVSDSAGIVGDVIAVGVANRFAAGALVHDVANRRDASFPQRPAREKSGTTHAGAARFFPR